MQSDYDIISGVEGCVTVSFGGEQWRVTNGGGLPSQMRPGWCVFRTLRCLSQPATRVTDRH